MNAEIENLRWPIVIMQIGGEGGGGEAAMASSKWMMPMLSPSSSLLDDDPGVMSEADTSSTGLVRRNSRQRSALPVVRTPSKTLERPLGSLSSALASFPLSLSACFSVFPRVFLVCFFLTSLHYYYFHLPLCPRLVFLSALSYAARPPAVCSALPHRPRP